MSFSGEVKEELVKHIKEARHCQLAELSAILYHCGNIIFHEDQIFVSIQSENEELVHKCSQLLFHLFQIEILIEPLFLIEPENVKKVLKATHFYQPEFFEKYRGTGEVRCYELSFSEILLKQSCCKRAFLRGSFLAIGSMSDPEKSYHLEFVCTNERQALQVISAIRSFDIEAKMVTRKKYEVVYVKEGESIVDLLNIMEAHVSLMNFENFRILKEMRNSINRQVNCEAANITKTVNAATKQVEDIIFLRDHIGLDQLPDNLREIAEVRLENPDTALKDLGGFLSPKVGKSGVYHRLKKLSEMADELRQEKE